MFNMEYEELEGSVVLAIDSMVKDREEEIVMLKEQLRQETIAITKEVMEGKLSSKMGADSAVIKKTYDLANKDFKAYKREKQQTEETIERLGAEIRELKKMRTRTTAAR